MHLPDYGVPDPEVIDQLYDVVRCGACQLAGISEVERWQRTRHVQECDLE